MSRLEDGRTTPQNAAGEYIVSRGYGEPTPEEVNHGIELISKRVVVELMTGTDGGIGTNCSIHSGYDDFESAQRLYNGGPKIDQEPIPFAADLKIVTAEELRKPPIE